LPTTLVHSQAMDHLDTTAQQHIHQVIDEKFYSSILNSFNIRSCAYCSLFNLSIVKFFGVI
jgi:hypothetical protein